MGSVSCQQMRQLEELAFREGETPESLMETSGRGIARAVVQRYPRPGVVVACIGKGNNGGDALVALRYLRNAGWSVGVRSAYPLVELGELPKKQWGALNSLGSVSFNFECVEVLGSGGEVFVVLDGLLGIGASGPLRSPLKGLSEWINQMRSRKGAEVIAMDVPSGLNADTGEVYEGAVVADVTLTVGVPKVGLLMPSATAVTGAIETIALKAFPSPDDDSPCLVDGVFLQKLLRRRPHDFHKGDAGRVGILAGSPGMLGAAVLCAQGALRSGAGLVTVFVYEENYPLLAPMMPPEVMVQPIQSFKEIRNFKFDAMAMGPGIGAPENQNHKKWFSLLRRLDCPMVLDADALNRLADVSLVKYLRENHVLTPHPGEMARLFPEGEHLGRLGKVRAFIEHYPETTLLLKGAHSLIAQSGKSLAINGSGHSGMACGGQGDVLTGVIAGLLAQGYLPMDAASLGAWLCGRAAELAVSHGGQSVESLGAGDILNFIGMAYRNLRDL